MWFSSFLSQGYMTDDSLMEHAPPKRAALMKWCFAAEKFIILIECCFSEFGVPRQDKMSHVV